MRLSESREPLKRLRRNPDMATSTPRREAETTFPPPGLHQSRSQVIIGDSPLQASDRPAKAMVALAHSLNNLLQQFTTQVTRLNTRREKPTQMYSGLIHENLTAFVGYVERFFEDNHVVEDNQKIEMFKGQLKDAARIWSQAFEGIPLSYQAFRESFLRKYNSTTDRSDAISMLYGEKQRSNESVEVFITRKRSLFARLNPNIEEAVMAQVIVDQLLPPIRSKLRGQVFIDILELAHYAGKPESDATDEAAYWRQLYAPTSRTPAPPPPRVTQPTSQQPGPARAPPVGSQAGGGEDATEKIGGKEGFIRKGIPRTPPQQAHKQASGDGKRKLSVVISPPRNWGEDSSSRNISQVDLTWNEKKKESQPSNKRRRESLGATHKLFPCMGKTGNLVNNIREDIIKLEELTKALSKCVKENTNTKREIKDMTAIIRSIAKGLNTDKCQAVLRNM